MKNGLKGSLAVAAALIAGSASLAAQSVNVNGLGSSALFLELGLGASTSSTIGASCVWSTNTSGTVVATDTSLGASSPRTDSGNAFVAWTPGTGGSCTAISASTQIYAYLQTDSVVGNRCLFNGCTIMNNGSGLASANLINSSEVALPAAIATALNGSGSGLIVSAAGTDIRPEDAEFAVTRALTACGTAVTTGSQYLGLGYTNGATINSYFSGSTFNVISFTLPSSFAVTPVGATPIVVVVNGNGATSGFSNPSITNVSSSALAEFLDGRFSFTNQALTTPAATGSAATVLIREPLSGTYNAMEYNVPNTVALQTSQDVGFNQPTAQRNCGSSASNPMNIATPSGGARKRAIGTGQELAEVIATQNSLGYGFWSVANFKGFTSAAAPNAKYLTVDGVDPLFPSTHTYTGTIPVTGSADLANVTLQNLNNATGTANSYPIWSLLRLVNIGTANSSVIALAKAAQSFVSFGTSTSRPDFITATNLAVVRSHFIPPVGAGEPTSAANGHVGVVLSPTSACTATEAGGDVGGVVYALSTDSAYCTNNRVTTGHTGQRR